MYRNFRWWRGYLVIPVAHCSISNYSVRVTATSKDRYLCDNSLLRSHCYYSILGLYIGVIISL